MKEDASELLEEKVSSFLAACDEALAAGAPLPLASEADVPPELRLDLERDLACVQWLRRVLPRSDAAGSSTPVLPGAAAQAEPASGLPWTSLGYFQLRRELGRGAFGVVYLAYDPRLGREVALKIPRMHTLADPELRERFQREAQAAAQLDHPNLVPVYQAGVVGPVCYIASAYCPGITLAQWLKQGDTLVPHRMAAALVAMLADGVHHAHQRGVVHRDLKPSNVLLQPRPKCNTQTIDSEPRASDVGLEYTPRVTDFGLAKFILAKDETALTGDGAILGTPSYMAPEQARGQAQEIGPAADIYSLGAILYELLTGRPPFRGETPQDTVEQVRSQEPVPPRQLQPKVPRALETVCLKCLQKDPRKRYVNGEQLADDLRRFLKGERIRARPISAWRRSVLWGKRRPAVAVLLLASVPAILLLAGLTGFLLGRQEFQKNGSARLYIVQAQSEWEAHRIGQAREWLDACPEDLRGPEWHKLDRLCNAGLVTLQRHTGPVSCVVFSPDGQYLASAGVSWDEDEQGFTGSEVIVWNWRTKQVVHTLKGYTEVASIAFNNDGKLLASVSFDGIVRVWEVQTGREVLTLKGHSGQVSNKACVAFSPDGKRLASTGQVKRSPIRSKDPNGEVIVWDATNGKPIHSKRVHTNVILSLAFNPDGNHLAVAGRISLDDSASGEVGVWDVETGQKMLTFKGHSYEVFSVAFSPDGKHVASAALDQTVKVWDRVRKQALFTFQVRADPGSVHRYNNNSCGVAFSPDGKHLASASADWTVKIWDVASGKEILPLKGHSGAVNSVAFSPDGEHLASASQDKTVKVWVATPLE